MERTIGRLTSILYRKSQVYLNTAFKSMDLTASEVPILNCLAVHEDVTQEQLSVYLVIDKASIARAVHSLIEKNYVKKEKDPKDNRANRIFLTDFAYEQLPEIKKRLAWWTTFLSEGLAEEELETAYTVLDKMAEKVETADFHETGGES